jgi:hypothetical protein
VQKPVAQPGADARVPAAGQINKVSEELAGRNERIRGLASPGEAATGRPYPRAGLSPT